MSEGAVPTVSPAGRGRLRIGHLARLFLGLVFVAAGLAKAVDPAEFAYQIAGYGILQARYSPLAALLLIAFEMALGLALLLGLRARATALVAAAVLVGFLGLKIHSLSAGRTDPCGCFGAYLKTSPGWGIALDAGFLLSALVAFWGLRDWAARRGRAKRLAVAAAAVISLGFAVISPRLPLDALVTRLAAGRSLGDLGIEGKVPGDGRRLVALLDLADPGTEEIAARLDAIAEKPGAPKVIALTASPEEEKAAFIWKANPAFEIEHVDRSLLKPLYRRLPRFFLVSGDQVVALYEDAPPATSDLISSEAS